MKAVMIDGDAVIIRIIGRYDFRHIAMIAAEVEDALRIGRCGKVVVDLSKTMSISAAGVRQLADLQKCVGKKCFHVVSPNPLVTYAFRAAGLGDVVALSEGDK